MEVERQEPCGGRDMASLDLDLLQLPELSPFALRERPSLPEALYRQWLSLPETSKSVRVVLLSFFFSSLSAGKMALGFDLWWKNWVIRACC